MGAGRRKEKEGKQGERTRRLRNLFFEFYALLATRFSLRLRLVRRREGQRWGPTSVSVFTVLTIQLFYVEKCFVAFLRVSQRAFWPNRFLC